MPDLTALSLGEPVNEILGVVWQQLGTIRRSGECSSLVGFQRAAWTIELPNGRVQLGNSLFDEIDRFDVPCARILIAPVVEWPGGDEGGTQERRGP
jgi:hypothetical protein